MANHDMQGQCLCGGVRYSASGPLATLVCHCKDCQRQSGSAFSVVVLFPTGNVEYRGTLSTFAQVGDSGLRVERMFCPKCGSAVVSRCEIAPGIDVIKSGTLDDTSNIRPAAQIYCDRKQAWVEVPISRRFPLAAPTEALLAAAHG